MNQAAVLRFCGPKHEKHCGRVTESCVLVWRLVREMAPGENVDGGQKQGGAAANTGALWDVALTSTLFPNGRPRANIT
ncbi:hypothetical protein E2C01_055870 [Portunus trituberculatus]|uniref:Uncharacterized protein n=1 Tax=Portunus trituberculatus TaxID=210409 RepID=A0A5B7GYU3_PORTR|nr:hypothetical protein [Portunus trituberculatus]